MMRYALGLDLGPAAEFTALAIVQADWPDDDAMPALQVGYLRRFPPGTPYAALAAEMASLLADDRLFGVAVVVDMTAVGSGVIELFRQMEPEPKLVPVVITAGHRAEWSSSGNWLVPKKELITGMQLLLQDRRLLIPTSLTEADLLSKELVNFRARTKLVADPQQAEWREGQDDDLVLAVALACWQAARSAPCVGSGFSVIPRLANLGRGESILGGRLTW